MLHNNDQYILAIRYLDLDKLKELLDPLSYDKILELKLTTYSNNILDYVIFELFSQKQTQITPSIDPISLSNINNNSESSLLTLKLIEYLCKICPRLITNQIFENILCFSNENKVLSILRNYYIDENSLDDCCIICYSSNNINLINNTCSCKNKIHMECLIELYRCNGSICKTCNNNNDGVVTKNNKIIFPFSNIYQQPLLINRYSIIPQENKILSLHYAIAYLQVNRVKDLLDKMNSDEFKLYIKQADYYALHKFQDGIIKIKDVPYTNLFRSKNISEFREIEILLKMKQLNCY